MIGMPLPGLFCLELWCAGALATCIRLLEYQVFLEFEIVRKTRIEKT